MGKIKEPISINIISFGYKYGLPQELHLCFDARFLKNTFYEIGFKGLNGLNDAVKAYILKNPKAEIFIKKILNFIKFLYPLFKKGGKTSIYIVIGCTGGRHI